jgi:hypothetical protein
MDLEQRNQLQNKLNALQQLQRINGYRLLMEEVGTRMANMQYDVMMVPPHLLATPEAAMRVANQIATIQTLASFLAMAREMVEALEHSLGVTDTSDDEGDENA